MSTTNATDTTTPESTHVVSPQTLLAVFSALMVLTVVTVGATYIELGPASLIVALAIAVTKAALVALYFMHLRWDSPLHGVILIVAFLFAAMFIVITTLDTGENLSNLRP